MLPSPYWSLFSSFSSLKFTSLALPHDYSCHIHILVFFPSPILRSFLWVPSIFFSIFSSQFLEQHSLHLSQSWYHSPYKFAFSFPILRFTFHFVLQHAQWRSPSFVDIFHIILALQQCSSHTSSLSNPYSHSLIAIIQVYGLVLCSSLLSPLLLSIILLSPLSSFTYQFSFCPNPLL